MAWRFCCLSCSHSFSYQVSTEIHCPQCGSDHIETNPFSLDSGSTLGEAERYYEEAEELARGSGDKLGLAPEVFWAGGEQEVGFLPEQRGTESLLPH